MLEEGDGPSMTADEPGEVDEEESVEAIDQSAASPAGTTSTAPASSLPLTPSTEDLSAKKKPPTRSGLRAPTAGKSESASESLNEYRHYNEDDCYHP